MPSFGKYRIIEPIASGGMADVYRAELPGAAGFLKEVALKVVRGGHDAEGEFVRMFIQEARLASRLGHANITITLDTCSHFLPALHEDATYKVAAPIFGP